MTDAPKEKFWRQHEIAKALKIDLQTAGDMRGYGYMLVGSGVYHHCNDIDEVSRALYLIKSNREAKVK